jgi:tetratricopeptide (TPR) repeat protein
MNKARTPQRRLRLGIWPALLTAAALLVLGSPVAAAESPRAAYEAGKRSADRSTRERLFADGMALARARLARQPDDPEGLYWLAVNLGAHALERGKMSALPVVPRMESLLLRLDQVAPGYEQAGAARVLGRLYHQAPAFISIGSSKQARRFLDRALALAPDHPGNLAFAADLLLSAGDKASARRYAERSLALLSGRKLGFEEREWSALARSVLEASR